MIQIKKNINLRDKNTFRIDVKCDSFVEFESREQLEKIFETRPTKWMVLSRGSNVLFTKDYEGLIIHPVGQKIEVTEQATERVVVRAEAGVEWDDFVGWCVDRGYWGVENLSYIPGYVGAAPVQNIGAYGVEAKDVILSVEMFDTESKKQVTLAGEHCEFGYRDSIFKRLLNGRVVITAVNFRLTKEAQPKVGYGDLKREVDGMGGESIENIRAAVIAIRRSKLPEPEELGNAGSFFKNPVIPIGQANALKKKYESMPLYPTEDEQSAKLAAGWLIDQAGWKGARMGAVGVHEHQALVLVNYGGATGGEVLELANEIKEDIAKKFGVELEMEVNVV